MSEIKKFGPYHHLQVMNFLPHRYPFLFVDRILEVKVPMNGSKLVEVGTQIIGLKNATINEPYFTGHFPEMPITPGVILIETMAQVSSFAMVPWVKTDAEMHVLNKFDLRLAGVDSARFRKPVLPGDSITIKSEVVKQRGPIWGFKCTAEVDGQVAAEAEILASVQLEAK